MSNAPTLNPEGEYGDNFTMLAKLPPLLGDPFNGRVFINFSCCEKAATIMPRIILVPKASGSKLHNLFTCCTWSIWSKMEKVSLLSFIVRFNKSKALKLVFTPHNELNRWLFNTELALRSPYLYHQYKGLGRWLQRLYQSAEEQSGWWAGLI